MSRKVVHVVGTGTIGEPLIGLLCDFKEDFTPSIDNLKSLISSKTKALILNSPNNPTGVSYPEKILIDICQVVSEAEAKFNSDIGTGSVMNTNYWDISVFYSH